MNTDNSKYTGVSSFFQTEKSIGFMNGTEPRRLAHLGEDGKWIADESEYQSDFDSIIEKLNTENDGHIAVGQIKSLIVSKLRAYYETELEFYSVLVKRLKNELILDLSGNKLLDVANQSYDNFSNILQSKGLAELDDLSELFHKYNALFHEFTNLIIVKKRAMKYIKEMVRLLGGTKQEISKDNIEKDNTKLEIARVNMALILDQATIMDFEQSSDMVNLPHIIRVLHSREFLTAQDLIRSFSQAV
jgi:hypothetical protein